jgi:hypothetical protein
MQSIEDVYLPNGPNTGSSLFLLKAVPVAMQKQHAQQENHPQPNIYDSQS